MKLLHTSIGRLIAVLLCLAVSLQPINAATFFYHTDHLGTPQVVTDAAQQVVWQGAQEPFGENTPSSNTIEQNLRFPGQYFEAETGLHYNYFRTYDPEVGRYLQTDPIGLLKNIDSPILSILYQSNRAISISDIESSYGYVEQDPIKYADYYGLEKSGIKHAIAVAVICACTSLPLLRPVQVQPPPPPTPITREIRPPRCQ